MSNWESHFSGLSWQVGQHMFHGFHGGQHLHSPQGGIVFILHKGHVVQNLFPKPTDQGGTLHPQCLCTASCLQVIGGRRTHSVSAMLLVSCVLKVAPTVSLHCFLFELSRDDCTLTSSCRWRLHVLIIIPPDRSLQSKVVIFIRAAEREL